MPLFTDMVKTATARKTGSSGLALGGKQPRVFPFDREPATPGLLDGVASSSVAGQYSAPVASPEPVAAPTQAPAPKPQGDASLPFESASATPAAPLPFAPPPEQVDGLVLPDMSVGDPDAFTGEAFDPYSDDGLDAWGFDREGFGKDGFNKAGYDREGYNRDGLNAAGYDRDGLGWGVMKPDDFEPPYNPKYDTKKDGDQRFDMGGARTRTAAEKAAAAENYQGGSDFVGDADEEERPGPPGSSTGTDAPDYHEGGIVGYAEGGTVSSPVWGYDVINGVRTDGNEQARNDQLAYIQQLQELAAGRGPSAARAQLMLAMTQNQNNMAAQAASARGINPALALTNALRQGSMANQNSAGQAALLRAQEQLAATGQLGTALGQMRQQDLLSSQLSQQAALANQNRLDNILGALITGGASALAKSGLGGGGGGMPSSKGGDGPSTDVGSSGLALGSKDGKPGASPFSDDKVYADDFYIPGVTPTTTISSGDVGNSSVSTTEGLDQGPAPLPEQPAFDVSGAEMPFYDALPPGGGVLSELPSDIPVMVGGEELGGDLVPEPAPLESLPELDMQIQPTEPDFFLPEEKLEEPVYDPYEDNYGGDFPSSDESEAPSEPVETEAPPEPADDDEDPNDWTGEEWFSGGMAGTQDLDDEGGPVPGEPKYPGVDHPANDTVDAELTPKEVVLPLSVTQSANPPEAARAFMQSVMDQEEGEPDYGDVLEARRFAEGGEVPAAKPSFMDNVRKGWSEFDMKGALADAVKQSVVGGLGAGMNTVSGNIPKMLSDVYAPFAPAVDKHITRPALNAAGQHLSPKGELAMRSMAQGLLNPIEGVSPGDQLDEYGMTPKGRGAVEDTSPAAMFAMTQVPNLLMGAASRLRPAAAPASRGAQWDAYLKAQGKPALKAAPPLASPESTRAAPASYVADVRDIDDLLNLNVRREPVGGDFMAMEKAQIFDRKSKGPINIDPPGKVTPAFERAPDTDLTVAQLDEVLNWLHKEQGRAHLRPDGGQRSSGPLQTKSSPYDAGPPADTYGDWAEFMDFNGVPGAPRTAGTQTNASVRAVGEVTKPGKVRR